MPAATATPRGVGGRSILVRNSLVFIESETSIRSNEFEPNGLPIRRPIPEPLETIAAFGATNGERTSEPLNSTMLSGSETSAVPKPPRKLEAAAT